MEIDNSDLQAKLDLRRHFLNKYHKDKPPRVLDCCQGDGVIWSTLRREFAIASYWGVDIKRKDGRLKIDSARILSQPGWTQDIIDIDTYGSPWKHYSAIKHTISKPATVFLTIGQWQMGTDGEILKAINIADLQPPPGISSQLHDFALSYLLTSGCDSDIIPIEAIEAERHMAGHARYVGVRLDVKAAAG